MGETEQGHCGKMGHFSLPILEGAEFFGAEFLIFKDLKFSVSFVSFVTFVSLGGLRGGALYLTDRSVSQNLHTPEPGQSIYFSLRSR